MKNVILSFDDGRLDTYENAAPIMESYGITATINVTTDFILHPDNYSTFRSAGNKAMSVEQIRTLYHKGFEIASHGNEHINDPDDIRKSIEILHGWGIDNVYGFASPASEIDSDSYSKFKELIEDHTLSYIRSGLQVRKQGLVFAGLYFIQNLSRSRFLYYLLNRKLCCANKTREMEYGVSVIKGTTVDQIMFLIERMRDNTTLILILHSILYDTDPGYGEDKWCWSEKKVRELCERIANSNTCCVLNNSELYTHIYTGETA